MKKSRSLYLLLFLFLFFQGYHFAFTKAQAASQVQSRAEIIRLNKLQTIDNYQQKEFAQDYILFIESNDDDDNSSDRKRQFTSHFHVLQGIITSLAALPEFCFSPQANNNSFYSPHYKYIFQRTLRV